MGLLSDVGALRFPVLSTGATSLNALDPARDIMLALFASAINSEFGAVWDNAVRRTPLEPANDPVRQRFPFEPEKKLLQEIHTKFPALFVYRHNEPQTIEQFTLWQRRYKSRWGVDYMLGPLDAGSLGRLQDILVAVGKIVGEVIEDGGHDSYLGGANILGTSGLGCCGFSTVELVDFRAGGARLSQDADASPYLACSCTIETTEFSKIRDGAAADFLGAAFTIGTGNVEGLDPAMVEATTDELP